MQKLVAVDSKFYLVNFPEPKFDFIGTVAWEQPIWVYAYPEDRFVAYSVNDFAWASYCGLGKRIKVLYDADKKGSKPKLPSGWVLPDDWYYKCEGYGDFYRIRVDIPAFVDYSVSPRYVTKVSGV